MNSLVRTVLVARTLPTCVYTCSRDYRPRKPKWMPRAKSKMFNVHHRYQVPDMEWEELKRLHDKYRIQCDAVRNYLLEEYESRIEQVSARSSDTLEDEELERNLRQNEAENARVAALRHERLRQRRNVEVEAASGGLQLLQEEEEQRTRDAARVIHEKQEFVRGLITPETLDEYLNTMINSPPANYNAAINTQGEKVNTSEKVNTGSATSRVNTSAAT